MSDHTDSTGLPSNPARRAFALSGLSVAGLGLLGLGGCGGGGDSGADNPRVRFINGLLDVASTDFYIDSTRAATGLGSGGKGSVYGGLGDGTHALKVHAAGSSTALAQASASFKAETDYSALAYGTAAAPKLRIFEENTAAAPAGQVKIRAFHATPAIGALDLHLVSTRPADLTPLTPFLKLTAYDTLTDFASIAAGTYHLLLSLPGTNTVVFSNTPVTLGATSVITLAVVPQGALQLAVAALVERGNGATLSHQT